MAAQTAGWRFVAGVVALFVLAVGAAAKTEPAAQEGAKPPSIEDNVTQGALRVTQKDGSIVECPLKHTDVKASISGFIARVTVTQTFENPFKEPIEAVYVFPLPHQAAVDDMTMVIGTRRIVGVIRKRVEARQIYEAAVAAGATAALLEQERPNIFTQSVGNIQPGQPVNVEISYVDVLAYDMGVYQFHFPMVVGPRFIPGAPISGKPPVPPELQGKVGEVPVPEGQDASGTGWSPDTTRVPDASRITPPVLKPGFRTGHDISLAVQLDAGVPIQDIQITNHDADLQKKGDSRAAVKLKDADSIPNKDFVLRYAVVGKKPEMAVLCHSPKGQGGYFMLMVQPKEDEKLKQAPPREIFFLVDVSGSMSGGPIAKVKEAMRAFLRLSKKDDRIQVVTFAGQAQELWEKPQPVDDKSITAAVGFVDQMQAGGGTYMLQGIKKVIEAPPDPQRVRIVVMLTDGYIGNEAEIIQEVGKKAGDRIRFWAIGIGSSPNRFLIDGVAKQGGGMGKDLGLNDKVEPLVEEIVMRIHRAQLADVQIDWGRLAVQETYPAKVPELWAGRPIILFGRYRAGGDDTIQVKGTVEGEAVAWPQHVTLLKTEPEHDVLAKVWARRKIESLMDQSYWQEPPEVVEEVTNIALEYRLMSQYTSFVAVDEAAVPIVPPAQPPRRMVVPVPLPEGTVYEGFFGVPGELYAADMPAMAMSGAAPSARPITPAPGRTYALAKRQSGLRGSPYGARLKEAKSSGGWAYGKADEKSSRLRQRGPAGPRIGGAGRDPAFLVLPQEEVRASVKAADLAFDDELGRGDYRLQQAFVGDYSERQKAAQEALTEVETLRKKGDLRGAWATCQAAWLLDPSGAVSGQAEQALAELAEEIEKQAVEKLPGLKEKLNLVIRDQSLEEALRTIAKTVKVKVGAKPGSLDDARRLLDRQDLRVTYLDLRGVTVAQALTWITNPFHLTWQVDGETAEVASGRRMAGERPWTYDVSLIAIPTKEELGEKVQEVATQAAADFLAAIRLADPKARWIGAGRLLVIGPPQTHQAVQDLLDALRDPKTDATKMVKAADEKQKALVSKVEAAAEKRHAARKDDHAKWLAARDRLQTLGALYEYSWRLLGEAAAGRPGDETLTELRIAWSDPNLPAYVKEGAAATVVRSFWIVTESATALKDNADLQALAKAANAVANPAAAVEALEKDPKDAGAYLAVVYARMAVQNALGLNLISRLASLLFHTRANQALEKAKENAAAFILPALEATGSEAVPARKALVEAIEKGVQGPDLVLLTALAARAQGGETWQAFRVAAADLLGRQPLPGGVIVKVNRLDQ